jgi:hypothetical protein
MGACVSRSPEERVDLGVPARVVARGVLNMATGLWVGAHPGFTDVLTDTGVGDFDVHLVADGVAATMMPRVTPIDPTHNAGVGGPLHGAGARDLQVLCVHYEGALCALAPAGGWNAGAPDALGAALPHDGIVMIEILDFAV